ncbi:unnamed protein product [Strongylus vulgaris]|uniref:Uncharacterized protein n=1 Tax=Strongylus vulgaris TaxID=40348 RepID=A0A3P7LK23_STRVU|nr:unnamed protein product [Strongylus vulgaris]
MTSKAKTDNSKNPKEFMKKRKLTGERYGVAGIVSEERVPYNLHENFEKKNFTIYRDFQERKQQEVTRFEKIENLRPATAHFRSHKLRWKDGEEGSREENLTYKILSSPIVIVPLVIIALSFLYYLNRKFAPRH